MALVLNDRVKETSTTTGTGTFDLDGAVTGFETFVAGIASTNTCYYCIAHQTANEWEVGLGTVTDATPDTLSRDTVLASSNSDGKVDFTAGTSDVFCTYPASKTMDMALTTTGDTVYASAANTPARLAVGSARQVLQTNSAGTLPEWVASPQSILTGQGDLLYTSAANTLARLAAGTGNYHLTMNSGGTAPEWTEVAAGIEWESVQTSSPITGAAGKGYPVNTTSGAITLNLPAGVVGEQVAVVDYAGTFDSNALTISADGSEKIKGSTNDVIMETERQAGVLTYVDATQGWVLTSAAPDPGVSPAPLYVTATGGTITTSGDYKIHTFTGDGAFAVSCAGNTAGSNTVDYMVIAGGGGGSGDGSGGGGAGGYRESPGAASGYTASPLGASPAVALAVPTGSSPYAITVGGGGPAPYSARGASGSNSVFSSITSTGGGGAGHPPGPADACKAGNSGGSGGGAGTSPAPLATAGAGNTPPTTPPQGNNGTDGNPYPACSGVSGGGGGAGGAAPATTSALDGTSGIGGVGTTSCISASPTKYAGGGGGCINGSGLATNGRPNDGNGGGPFGGGFGSSSSIPTGHVQGTAGGTNLGGGGGGGASNAAGRAGGSGVVVIRYKYQ